MHLIYRSNFVLKCYLLLISLMAQSSVFMLKAQVLDDTTFVRELAPVVVTATRSAKDLTQISVPLSTISATEIAERGRIRLADVLSDLPNLNIRYNFGAGVQIQGLDPAYTLILLDGEPLIGRNAGTLDLNRLSLENIERIEIVRGASSSLYGSEALAGVINIITRQPNEALKGNFSAQYETHRTLSTSLQVERLRKIQEKKVGFQFSANRHSSNGYALTSKEGIDPTVPAFTDYTFSSKLRFQPNTQNTWHLSGRLGTQTQKSITNLVQTDRFVLHDQSAERTDWNVAADWKRRFVARQHPNSWQTKFYASRYLNLLTLTPKSSEVTSQVSRFDQHYFKLENQFDWLWHKEHLAILGGGISQEQVAADRIAGGKRTQQNAFFYAQNDYVGEKWDGTASFRLDAHSAYKVHLSPRISALYKPNATWRLRASVGSGFKAPTFQQLYMDFSNSVVGYSIFGTTGISEGIKTLLAQGQIQDLLMDVSQLATIRPETAWAFNLGAEWKYQSGKHNALTAKANVFRNHVKNLIETAPIATKTSGQQVFTYFNLHQIYTQGIETEFFWKPNTTTTFSGSYTLLDTADENILDKIRQQEIYTTVNGRARLMKRHEYGGLMNRSRHSATMKVSQNVSFSDWLYTDVYDFMVHLRGSFTGKYGFSDINGNLVLDIPDEYVKGYTLWHLNIQKPLKYATSLQLGIENIFGHTNPRFIPALSGRIFYIGLKTAFSQKS